MPQFVSCFSRQRGGRLFCYRRSSHELAVSSHSDLEPSLNRIAVKHSHRIEGKLGVIHPRHLQTCNAIFTPPPEDVAEARKIIAAFASPENASRGAIQIDGRMVERLHAEMAKRTIAIADAIAAMT